MKTEWDVAYAIEKIAEEKFGFDFDHSGTIFDRDRIQIDTLYDVMSLLLHMYGKSGSIDFMNKYYDVCQGKRMSEIKDYEKIYNEFILLID